MKTISPFFAFAILFPIFDVAQAEPPAPPKTQITNPTRLISAEAFEKPDSLAEKGSEGWRGGIGEWQVKAGTLHATDEKPNEKRPNGHEAVCEYVTEAKDIVFTAEFKLGSAPHVGFVCRDTNNPNHHLGRIMVTPTSVWIQKMSGIAKETKKEILHKIDTPFDTEQWYRVTIEVTGDTWLATVGKHELTAKNDRFKDPKGRVGMVAKGEGAEFRKVALWHAEPK